MEADDLLCSRNARLKKALVGRAQWKINQLPSLRSERASLKGGMRGQARGSPVLVQRAVLEDPRWTRAVGDPLARPQGSDGRALVAQCAQLGSSQSPLF